VKCVTIEQLVELAASRQVAVPAELGGCIVLAAADQILAQSVEPTLSELFLFDDGLVRVSGERQSDPRITESGLRGLLGTLIGCASSVTPALLRAAGREPGGDLIALVHELEIALVPINRGAAKRALARLCREAVRAVEQVAPMRDAPSGFAQPAAPIGDSQRQEVHAEECGAEPVGVSVEPPGVLPVLEIPDLEVPRPSAPDFEPSLPSLGESTVLPSVNPSESGILELSDADVVELTESVECPPVFSGEYTRGPDHQLVMGEQVPYEPTSPFPLVRVQGPAAATTDGKRVGSACVPAAGALAATDVVATTDRMRGRDSSANPVNLAVRVGRAKKPIFAAAPPAPMSGPTRAEAHSGSSGDVAERAEPEGDAREEGRDHAMDPPKEPPNHATGGFDLKRKPMVEGPHHFIARAFFAKKSSKVSDCMSQFRQMNQAAADQLVDGLSLLATAGEPRCK